MSGPDKETAAKRKAAALRENLRRRKAPELDPSKTADTQETSAKPE